MAQVGRIVRVNPSAAIPGGEVLVECEGFEHIDQRSWKCRIGETECRLIGASKRRILAFAPGDSLTGETAIEVEIGGVSAEPSTVTLGKLLAEDLHPVANPAFDPSDNSLFVTRSGSRGQHLPMSLFKISPDGEIEGFSGEIPNPTGIAFDPSGQMYVSSRLNGTVYRVGAFGEPVAFAQNLGVATGLAFNADGTLFVGDRSGTIYRVNGIGEATPWATHEPSVSAYHLAFGPDNDLFVTGPTVSSFDSVTRFDRNGTPSVYFRGLGRPQGMAFDTNGNLYVAASLRGRRGIVRIAPGGLDAELVVAGMNVVGLCFGPSGEMAVATNDAVYTLPFGVKGILLR
jgi:sugar lactone lactonase YvrE